MCVPDSNAEALIPNVIILADGEIGREVDLDEVMRVEHSELINTLIRKDEKDLSGMSMRQEDCHVQVKKKALTTKQTSLHLYLGFLRL